MIYAILAMVIWSTTAIQVRLINVDSVSVLFWSNLTALLPAFVMLYKHKKSYFEMFIKYKYILLSVAFCALINGLSYFYSIKLTSIANALMTHYMTPVIVAVLAPILLKEHFSMIILIALILSLTGLIIIIDPAQLRFQSDDFTGIVYGLISAFAYAAVILIGRFFKAGISPFVYILAQSSVAVLFTAYFTNMRIVTFDFQSIILIITFGLFNIFFAAYLFFKSLTKVNASIVGIIGYIEPVGAILLGIILLKEPMTLKIGIGCFLILFSSTLVNLKR